MKNKIIHAHHSHSYCVIYKNEILNAKRILILTFCFIGLSTQSEGQCWRSYRAIPCNLPIEHSLIEAYEFATNRTASFVVEENWIQRRKDKFLELATDDLYKEKLDSIFRLARQSIIDKIGKNNYCDRIKLDWEFVKLYKYYNRKERKKLLEGSFSFKFFHNKIDCWNGGGTKLVYKFKFEDNNNVILEHPVCFPDCEDLDCPEYLPSSEIIKKALAQDLIDDSRRIRIKEFDCNSYIINNIKNIIADSALIVSKFTGDLIRKEKINRNWTQTTLENSITQATLIADVMLDSTYEYRGKNDFLYTTYLYSILNILKGNIPDEKKVRIAKVGGKNEYSSHSTPLPNGRVLLFLKPMPKEYFKSIAMPDSSKQYFSFIADDKQYSSNRISLFGELVPFIKKQTSLNIRPVIAYNHTTNAVTNWLQKQNAIQQKDSIGLQINMSRLYWNYENSAIFSNVYAKSTKDHSYPTKIKLTFEYDTSWIGSWAVSNNNIMLDRFYHNENRTANSALFPNQYTFKTQDESHNKFSVIIESSKDHPLKEISDSTRNIDQIPLFNIGLKVSEMNQEEQFTLQCHSIISPEENLHIEAISGDTVPYSFICTTPNIVTLGTKSCHESISKISNATATLGDTLTIHGTYLNNFKGKIYLPFAVEKNGIEYRNNYPIPQSHLLHVDDSTATFVIPRRYGPADGLDNWVPVSGLVKLDKNIRRGVELEIEQ